MIRMYCRGSLNILYLLSNTSTLLYV